MSIAADAGAALVPDALVADRVDRPDTDFWQENRTIAAKTSRYSAQAWQLKNLRTFVCVAYLQSVTRAAEHLGRVPSVITRSINEFERCIGLPVFERRHRGMAVNVSGEAVLVRSRRIEHEIEVGSAEFLRSGQKGKSVPDEAITNFMFDGHKLQLLIHLADTRNMSRTANELGMTQAGASMALARIETTLGQPLFTRTIQGMEPTDGTKQLVMRARRIFAELRHLASDIQAISGKVAGSIVIGTLPLGRTYVFPTAIAEAISAHPDLRVTMIENPYEHLVSSLRSGDIDVIFGSLRPNEPSLGLSTETLFTDRLSIMVRAGHSLASRTNLTMADLLGEKWILPKKNGNGWPLVVSAFGKFELAPPVASVETSDVAILRQLLIASDMIAMASPHQMMYEIRSGLLTELPVALGESSRDIGIVRRDAAMLSPAAMTLIEAVQRQARKCFG
jgi:LysR family transcriptional regulator of gallate degradation